MHVTSPAYPLAPAAQYAPSAHPLSAALALERRLLGPSARIVLVQPSVYGTDNACTLDALREAGGPARARAVVQIDPGSVTRGQLEGWHALGVRGVRVNLVSVGKWGMGARELEEVLERQSEAVRGLGWALQLYVPLRMCVALEGVVPRLGVRVVLDHMGQPGLPHAGYARTRDPYELEGFAAMVRLLEGGHVWVKMSAAYRIGKEEDYLGEVEPIAREILCMGGRTRVVFATDWPHTRFEGMDVEPFVKKVVEWCEGDEELLRRVFRDNAQELWDAN